MAFSTNLLTLTPILKPCCDPQDDNPAVVLPESVNHASTAWPSQDVIEEPLPPPQPPPSTQATTCLLQTNNNNNNIKSDNSSVNTESSDMDALSDWLVESVKAGTTFRSGYEHTMASTPGEDCDTAMELTPAERSLKQEAVTCHVYQSVENTVDTLYGDDTDSECSELDALIEDLNHLDSTPATYRWCHKVKVPRPDGLSFLGDNISHEEEDDFYFPPGCSFDLTRPPSPRDIRDFPDVTFTPIPRPKYMLNKTADVMEANDFNDTLDALTNNLVVNVKCMVRTLDLGHDTSTRVYRLFRKEDGSLIDTGANICMTNSTKGLVNVKSIDPIPVGVAVQSEQQSVATCNQMGYLPMLREDGHYHYQPFLINPDASDMIMSLASIIESSDDFFSWEQVGFKDGRPGYARIFDKEGKLLLMLKCEKRQGLYYHSHERLDRHCEPVFTPDISDATLNKLSSINITDDDYHAKAICNHLRSTIPSMVDPLPSSSKDISCPDFDRPTSIHRVSMPPSLPTLDETTVFDPILDPYSEVTFDENKHNTPLTMYSPDFRISLHSIRSLSPGSNQLIQVSS